MFPYTISKHFVRLIRMAKTLSALLNYRIARYPGAPIDGVMTHIITIGNPTVGCLVGCGGNPLHCSW
jgi:hypothetical protein